MFRNLKLWGRSATESHYEEEANRASDQFQNLPPDLPPWAEEIIDEGEPADPDDELTVFATNLELHEFGGDSEDVEWMTYNHDTNEVIIQFLEHGRRSAYSGIYAIKGVPYDLFQKIIDGTGPFPTGRDPHYLKTLSTGQVVNYYLRHDQADDRYEYEKVG